MGTGLEGSAGDSGKREKARLVFFSGNMSLSLRMDWQGEVIRFLSSVFGEGGIPFSPYATVYMSIGQKRNGAERESQGVFII